MENYRTLFSLQGKTALITGGTSGLGHAIAKAFLADGANVIICSRKLVPTPELTDCATQTGSKLIPLQCDISNQEDVKQFILQLKKITPNIDILINSAGINKLYAAEDYSLDDFNQVMSVNVTGMHLITQAIGKEFMIPQKAGRILNLSSVKGTLGAAEDYLAYCTSKGAVNMYTKQIACEWGKYNITANAVAPTFVRTPINSVQLDDPTFYQRLTQRIPLGTIGNFEDIACAAMYLCSDAAKFVSGQILYVDGGLTSRQ